jgi:hypothetical protein
LADNPGIAGGTAQAGAARVAFASLSASAIDQIADFTIVLQ